MAVNPEVELDRLIEVAQHTPDVLVQRMKGDPRFKARVDARLARYAEMEKKGRMDACWISRRARETLTKALGVLANV